MTGERLTDAVTLYCGDCLELLRTLEPNSVDSCVTDPPYGLEFMGKAWDHGVPGVAYWREVLRVLKPGAHLLSFGGTRTFGRMHVAIEDAGFEIRDMISWLYGSGFPKSLDVSKAIDKVAGAKREVVGVSRYANNRSGGRANTYKGRTEYRLDAGAEITAPASDSAREWSGFGTALKPACEPIALARKPLSESTVAANVLKWGTGVLNIDGCRVEADTSEMEGRSGKSTPNKIYGANINGGGVVDGTWRPNNSGRWPANVIHDGGDEVVGAFPVSEANGYRASDSKQTGAIFGSAGATQGERGYDDTGSAARFFYTAKADSNDRLGSKHPTVKPLDLMQYLVRLVCPPKGLVLDPFAGTGTTGEACIREGLRAVLIEREEEYQEDIRRRMSLAMCGTDSRKRAAWAARNKDKPIDPGPLFADLSFSLPR